MEKIKKLTEKVEFVLEKYPQSRDCDIYLTLKLWQKFEGVTMFLQTIRLFTLPRLDNISHIRRKIQNKEFRFLPTKIEVVKQRRINEARRIKEMSL